MIKEYPQTYEKRYSEDPPKRKNKFNLEKVSAGMMSMDEYISLFRGSLNSFFTVLFDESVRFSWLRRKFSYFGEKFVPKRGERGNSHNISIGLAKFSRRYLGSDTQIITRSVFFQTLESYFDLLFPDFDEGNPFENPDYYKFPFKNITIAFLPFVRDLDERMALLQIADDRKMNYAMFADYVINFVNSVNEELGYDRYELTGCSWWYLPFIRDNDKKKKKK
jgi:hypothetical protein